MCPSTPIEEYARQICAAAKQISSWCEENQQPQPSFGPSTRTATLPPTAPQSILTARQNLVEAAFKVQQLATEPNEYLSRLAVHYQVLASVHWLCHFRIFSFVPITGSVPLSEVAALAMVPENQLKAIARMAMTSNLLCETKPGELAHTPASALFVTNPAVLDWALFMTKGSAPTASKMVEATDKWGDTSSMIQTAFNVAHDTDLSFFEYISQTPDMAKLFVSYMKNVTSSEGTKIDHLIRGFDWAALGRAKVVDMGGSDCHASIALASAYPNLSFVVQDLPQTIAQGPALLAKHPEAIRRRISCQEHNFFTPQPTTDADVYFLRMIFHDWPDKEALTILRHLVPVLKTRPLARSSSNGNRSSHTTSPNGTNGTNGTKDAAGPAHTRLVIMDTVLPEPGAVPSSEEGLLRVRDLTMLQAFNGKERGVADWKALFATASSESGVSSGQLELISVNKPFGSLMSLLEVAFVSI